MSDKPLVPCYGTFFARALAGRDLVSGVQLARRPVLNESADHQSAMRKRHKLDPAYILTPLSPQAFGWLLLPARSRGSRHAS